jgi:hypothetical protein
MQPERVLSELRELWQTLGKQQESGGVLRACAMTLIVAAADNDDSQELGGILAALMPEHPSRLILIRRGEAGLLDARVNAQCWRPFGSRQQICCEQIEISAGNDRLGDAARSCLPLLAPDLPVVLWCRAEPVPVSELFGLAQRIIFDTATAGTPALLRRVRRIGCRVADLAWSRLTAWRQALAAAYAAAGSPQVQEVEAAEPYLEAWLRRAFPEARLNRGSRGEVILRGPGVQIRCPEVTGSAEITGLMRRELAISGPDRVFEEVLERIVA